MSQLYIVTVTKYAQEQDPETKAAKWNSAIIHVVIYTFVFSYCDISHCLLWESLMFQTVRCDLVELGLDLRMQTWCDYFIFFFFQFQAALN